MQKILMCPVDFFSVDYAINPWMDTNIPVNLRLAKSQWEALKNCLQDCGATVECLTPVPDLPDLIFTANAALWAEGQFWIAHFAHPERMGETPINQAYFTAQGYTVHSEAHLAFEGEGDGFFWGGRWLIGIGPRTSMAFVEYLKKHLEHPVVPIPLIHPHFYHLDTCFCPLNEHQALYYPKAFDKGTQSLLQHWGECIPVSDEQAQRFACNSIVVGHHLIMPAGNEMLAPILETYGFTCHFCDVSEFIKAGGACKCLCLYLPSNKDVLHAKSH